jgi:hypothetical protein
VRVSWLSLKTKVDGLSMVWPQNHYNGFLWSGLKTGGNGFLVELQNQGGGGFPGLGLKIGSYNLMIWVSKLPRWFIGFGLKTKRASVCRLCHKTDGGGLIRDTRRDLAACFVWKQHGLGFFSLASRLMEA